MNVADNRVILGDGTGNTVAASGLFGGFTRRIMDQERNALKGKKHCNQDRSFRGTHDFCSPGIVSTSYRSASGNILE
ncbi:MAG: hypothetical protein ABSB41_17960 [Anaerolineales bacterium]